jgi:8-amino-7-oxononanoate synthase
MMDFAQTSPLGPRVLIAGRERDYFSGTGYLGLHNHPAVQQAAIDCIRRYGLSTGTSRGGYGEHPVYERLDNELRAFLDAGRALYFASGYLGGMIICQGLRDDCQRIFIDERAHFSVFDAARAAGKPLHTFPHLDPQGLEESLRRELQPGERPLVLSDGVFPISGEIAPLPELMRAVEPYAGIVALDDAHAAGVLGAHGRGTADYFNISPSDRLVASATLSKALGGFGGILAGGTAQIDWLERNSKVYVAASPPPLPAAAASAQALQIARLQPDLRARLHENVRLARQGLRALGWDLPDTPVPILCLSARPGLDLARIKAALYERDICIAHVTTYSSTPPGGALRIAIFADHSQAQIERLLHELSQVI